MAWILKVYNDDDDDEIKDRQRKKRPRWAKAEYWRILFFKESIVN